VGFSTFDPFVATLVILLASPVRDVTSGLPRDNTELLLSCRIIEFTQYTVYSVPGCARRTVHSLLIHPMALAERWHRCSSFMYKQVQRLAQDVPFTGSQRLSPNVRPRADRRLLSVSVAGLSADPVRPTHPGCLRCPAGAV